MSISGSLSEQKESKEPLFTFPYFKEGVSDTWVLSDRSKELFNRGKSNQGYSLLAYKKGEQMIIELCPAYNLGPTDKTEMRSYIKTNGKIIGVKNENNAEIKDGSKSGFEVVEVPVVVNENGIPISLDKDGIPFLENEYVSSKGAIDNTGAVHLRTIENVFGIKESWEDGIIIFSKLRAQGTPIESMFGGGLWKGNENILLAELKDNSSQINGASVRWAENFIRTYYYDTFDTPVQVALVYDKYLWLIRTLPPPIFTKLMNALLSQLPCESTCKRDIEKLSSHYSKDESEELEHSWITHFNFLKKNPLSYIHQLRYILAVHVRRDPVVFEESFMGYSSEAQKCGSYNTFFDNTLTDIKNIVKNLYHDLSDYEIKRKLFYALILAPTQLFSSDVPTDLVSPAINYEVIQFDHLITQKNKANLEKLIGDLGVFTFLFSLETLSRVTSSEDANWFIDVVIEFVNKQDKKLLTEELPLLLSEKTHKYSTRTMVQQSIVTGNIYFIEMLKKVLPDNSWLEEITDEKTPFELAIQENQWEIAWALSPSKFEHWLLEESDVHMYDYDKMFCILEAIKNPDRALFHVQRIIDLLLSLKEKEENTHHSSAFFAHTTPENDTISKLEKLEKIKKLEEIKSILQEEINAKSVVMHLPTKGNKN